MKRTNFIFLSLFIVLIFLFILGYQLMPDFFVNNINKEETGISQDENGNFYVEGEVLIYVKDDFTVKEVVEKIKQHGLEVKAENIMSEVFISGLSKEEREELIKEDGIIDCSKNICSYDEITLNEVRDLLEKYNFKKYVLYPEMVIVSVSPEQESKWEEEFSKWEEIEEAHKSVLKEVS